MNSIEGFIQSRDFGNGDVVYPPRGKTYKKDMLQDYSLDFLERVADRRSESERGNARSMWMYGRRRMPNRGMMKQRATL